MLFDEEKWLRLREGERKVSATKGWRLETSQCHDIVSLKIACIAFSFASLVNFLRRRKALARAAAARGSTWPISAFSLRAALSPPPPTTRLFPSLHHYHLAAAALTTTATTLRSIRPAHSPPRSHRRPRQTSRNAPQLGLASPAALLSAPSSPHATSSTLTLAPPSEAKSRSLPSTSQHGTRQLFDLLSISQRLFCSVGPSPPVGSFSSAQLSSKRAYTPPLVSSLSFIKLSSRRRGASKSFEVDAVVDVQLKLTLPQIPTSPLRLTTSVRHREAPLLPLRLWPPVSPLT